MIVEKKTVFLGEQHLQLLRDYAAAIGHDDVDHAFLCLMSWGFCAVARRTRILRGKDDVADRCSPGEATTCSAAEMDHWLTKRSLRASQIHIKPALRSKEARP